jgi:hypothetical protein
MRAALLCHPLTPCDAIAAIDVEVTRAGLTGLTLRYTARGDTTKLLLPTGMLPERRDGLWQHTCFEAFAQASGGQAYSEFNFSPSFAWAAYQFDSTRTGMRPAEDIDALEIGVETSPKACSLTAAFSLPGEGPWNVGLSAVIEETAGRKSYWALAHPGDKPDFHRADCFTLKLA